MMKKQVLFLIEDGSYTFDNRVKNEVNALLQEKWDITVICPRTTGDPRYVKISDKLRIYYFPKREGKSVFGHLIEHTQTLLFTFLLTLYVFVKHGFSVIHANNPMDIFWIIAFPYKKFGKKFVFDQHDLCPELFVSRYGKSFKYVYSLLLYLEYKSYRMADIVLSTNKSYKEVAIKRGEKEANHIYVVRNGIHYEKYAKIVINQNIRNAGEKIIGYIGNMNIQDGVDYLLNVAKIVVFKKNIKNIKFYLIGGGALQKSLKLLSNKMGLSKYVVFTGRISDDEMFNILLQADICVQPDPLNEINDISSMNKVIEYMVLKKPIIAFKLKETIYTGGGTIMYAENNDINDFSDKLVFLLNNPNCAAKLGNLAFDRVIELFLWEKSEKILINAYNSLLHS